MKKNYLLGAARVLAMLVWVLLMPIMFMLGSLLRVPGHKNIVHIFHQGTCVILGIRASRSGEISQARPTLYVSNHSSYIDVFVLGNLRAYFIAKSEVATWPLFGRMAKFQNTLFFERRAGAAKQQLEILKRHLQAGDSLTLFPEGTSTDGVHVEPFKSTLFEAANLGETDVQVAIQPITIAYTHHAGQRMHSQRQRDHYAWYRNMPFAPHFFGLFPLKSVDAKIHFHPVCYLDDFATRKQCAEHCHSLVAEKLQELLGLSTLSKPYKPE